MYVCLCKGVTDRQLQEAVSDGARSWKEAREMTGCSTQCGKCACVAKAVVRDAILTEMQNYDLAYAV
ncbi:(2Fe-2S)-binding protein [Phytohalomonas tamaricis]|uniref:(2Fe-2S)-binding protein n=1 Tax=Phytohalomonas tamaricis TaxID=2081032 RepID=UPI000D0B2644|nr:(2Fe-2S)-binding protein [Phytohalomonas tamaricis]